MTKRGILNFWGITVQQPLVAHSLPCFPFLEERKGEGEREENLVDQVSHSFAQSLDYRRAVLVKPGPLLLGVECVLGCRSAKGGEAWLPPSALLTVLSLISHILVPLHRNS